MALQERSSSEEIVAEARLMVNVLTAYERVRLRLGRRLLHADWPETVLGIVPIRRNRLVVPLAEVRSIRLTSAFFPTRLLVVGVVFLFAAAFDPPPLVTASLGLVALLFALLGVVAAIEITTAETRAIIPVCWLQRTRALGFIDMVERSRRSENDP